MRLSAIILAISVAATILAAASTGAVADPEPVWPKGEDRIHLGGGALSVERPLTLLDIVGQRTVSSPRVSPDGARVAFLVSQAFEDCNCRRVALFVEPISGSGPPTKLLETEGLSVFQWRPDGSAITYLDPRSAGQHIAEVDIRSHTTSVVLDLSVMKGASPSPFQAPSIVGFHWSHDGRALAIEKHLDGDSRIKDRMVREGYRYDDLQMWDLDLANKAWDRSSESVTLDVFTIANRTLRTLWSSDNEFLPELNEVSWSPDDTKLAFVRRLGDSFSEGLETVYVASGVISVVDTSPNRKSGVQWLPNSTDLSYGASSEEGVSAIFVTHRHLNPEPVNLGFSGDGGWTNLRGDTLYLLSSRVGAHRVMQGLYRVSLGSGRSVRVTPSNLKTSDCDEMRRDTVVCVVQSPTLPPNVSIINLADGSISLVTDINPEMAKLQLGSVKELWWKNEFGEETNGYLVLPKGYKVGPRLPMVVMGYGFDGDFVTWANRYLTSYPAQMLAARGFAVLLFNYPTRDWGARGEPQTFKNTLHGAAEAPLSSLRTIISKLASEDIIDPARVGYAGHSYAGYFVEYALEHSNLLAAGELHNGGTSVEPKAYSEVGNKLWRDIVAEKLGGPPWGRPIQNYQRLASSMNAFRVRAPVMLDYDDFEAQMELDVYAGLRSGGAPVDFYIYPGDGHVFEMPSHQLAAMQRNIDWFSFWLQGYVDPDPGKAAQYARWRSLKVDMERLKLPKKGAGG